VVKIEHYRLRVDSPTRPVELKQDQSDYKML
jgi:hypothetical protein